LEEGANAASQVVVHDVFEIDLVEIVGPGVEHAEALVLDALGAVFDDVLLEELEVGLVGGDGVGQVVLVELFLGVADERANSLNAGRRLEVLILNLVVEDLGDSVNLRAAALLEHALEDLLEALKVPVLVNASVDDLAVKDLLGLEGQEVAEVVKVVNCGLIGAVAGDVGGQ
jgi:hypothetical protein